MITIIVEDLNGDSSLVKIAQSDKQTLMDALQSNNFKILGSCGGLALCGTCHVQFMKGADQLPAPLDVEMQMLDMLPDASPQSRLSCQVVVDSYLSGTVLRLMPVV